MKIEMHVHTRYSKDSILNKYFLLWSCKLKKINCVVLTDHNNIKAVKYKSYLENQGIQVILGEEIMTQEGEIIGIFLKKKIMPMMTAKHTIEEIKRQGGLVYVPHPVDKKRHKTVLKREVIFDCAFDIDFIEIYNGRNSSQEDINMETDLYCELKKINPNVVAVVGSDAHICWEIGRNIEIVPDMRLDVFNIKTALQQAQLVKNKPIVFTHKWTKIVKIFRLPMTLETMKYDVASMAEVMNRSEVLAEYIYETFQPEIVVFVAKGGFLIGKAVSSKLNVPLYEVSTERSGGKLKKIIAQVFRLLPTRCRFWMIDLEMNMGIHKKAAKRKVVVSGNLQQLANKQRDNLKRILIVDDSVDTGTTANAVKEKIAELFPQTEIRFASLSVIRFSEPMFQTDYYLYKDTIIQTGTSKDSTEYEEFIKNYTEWESSN